MKDKAFVDTNIFVYLYSEDEPQKQSCAFAAIELYDCVTSTQVLNELCNVCLKKLKMTTEIIENAIDEITEEFDIELIGRNTIKKALSLHKKYHFSYYDCLILASALACDCKYILTEDLNDGQIIENNLIIRNIFKNM